MGSEISVWDWTGCIMTLVEAAVNRFSEERREKTSRAENGMSFDLWHAELAKYDIGVNDMSYVFLFFISFVGVLDLFHLKLCEVLQLGSLLVLCYWKGNTDFEVYQPAWLTLDIQYVPCSPRLPAWPWDKPSILAMLCGSFWCGHQGDFLFYQIQAVLRMFLAQQRADCLSTSLDLGPEFWKIRVVRDCHHLDKSIFESACFW